MTEAVPKWLAADFFKELWKDIFIYGLDATIIIHGRKRTGKSTLALKILELINLMGVYIKEHGGSNNVPKEFFDEIVTKRVFFRVGKFAKAIALAHKPGMVLILDEAGVDASNLKWWDKTVKALRDIMHVDGIRHLILIIVLPKKMHFAKGTRDMVNIEIKTKKVDHRKKKAYCTIKHYGLIDDVNKDHGVYQRDKKGNRVTRYTVSPPHPELVKAYKRIETPAKEKIIQEKVAEIISCDPQNQAKISDYDKDKEILDSILANPDRYIILGKKNRKKKRLLGGLIESDFKVGSRVSTRIRQKIEADYPHLVALDTSDIYIKTGEKKTIK